MSVSVKQMMGSTRTGIREIKPEEIFNINSKTVSPELKAKVQSQMNSSFAKPSTTSVDELYEVRLSFDDAETSKGCFTNLNTAILECNKYAKYKVFNKEGKVVHVSTMEYKDLSTISSSLMPGQKIKLQDCKLYTNSTTQNAKTKVDGMYYIYDHVVYNGRYKISEEKNSDCIGYVNKDCIFLP